MRELTKAERRALSDAWMSDRVCPESGYQSFEAGFTAALTHIQPKFDTLLKLLRNISDNPASSVGAKWVADECLTILDEAEPREQANAATLAAMEGEDGR